MIQNELFWIYAKLANDRSLTEEEILKALTDLQQMLHDKHTTNSTST